MGTTHLSRRGFVAFGATAAATLAEPAHATLPPGFPNAKGNCSTVPTTPTADRPDPQENWLDYSAAEVALAFRNHGMQAEFYREPLTPLGSHYLLIHFDVPQLSAEGYSVAIGGRRPQPYADLAVRVAGATRRQPDCHPGMCRHRASSDEAAGGLCPVV